MAINSVARYIEDVETEDTIIIDGLTKTGAIPSTTVVDTRSQTRD